VLRAERPLAPGASLGSPLEKRSRSESVEDLLHALRGALPAALAERLRAGGLPAAAHELPRRATGVAEVDALLRGGLPRGRLCEIRGPLSSGRTSLVHAILAATTRAGEIAAVVDAADAFDAASAAAAGVDLERLLWARPPRAREALRCAERLLEARGFGVVVVDLERPAPPRGRDVGGAASMWLRMTRSALASGTTLVLVGMRAGPFAALALETRTERARFDAPGWLDGLDARVAPLRSRIGAFSGAARVAWRTRAG
jgi:hypothetical protein